MFELADRLVGIYKTDNCTKSVTINPHLLEEAVPPPSQPNLTTIQASPAKTVSRSSSHSSIVPLGESNLNMD